VSASSARRVWFLYASEICPSNSFAAGLSSSVETQLKEILEVVGSALKGVSARHKEIEKAKELARNFTEQTEAHTKEAFDKMERVTHHDGRLDSLAGGGVIGELGVGDERMTEKDQNTKHVVQKAVTKRQEVLKLGKQAVPKPLDTESKTDSTKSGWAGNPVSTVQGVVKEVVKDTKQSAEKLLTATKDQLGIASEEESSPRSRPTYKERTEIDEEIQALPVVVIKNYSTKSTLTDELVTVLAEWAAGLADGGLAHVVVMSDNRDNGRRLEKGQSQLRSKRLQLTPSLHSSPRQALDFDGAHRRRSRECIVIRAKQA
jgi:RNA12 protein